MAKFGARIQIDSKQFDLNNETIASGDARSLVLKYLKYTLTFGFSDGRHITGSSMWFLIKVVLNVTDEGKVKTSSLQSVEGIKAVVAHKSNSFACDAGMYFNLTGDFNATLHAIDFRIEPFVPSTANGFGLMERCDADKMHNNVVPIAVGAALAVLVVIVLILYLIGRRKHQRGYETV